MFDGWGNAAQRVSLTLYTDAYVIRGSLQTPQRRLLDVLNNADESFLVLDDAAFEPIVGRGLGHRAPSAQVNLDAVLFSVAHDSVDPSPELRTPKVAETTLISLPPFNITGRIHLLPERDVRAGLQELRGRFLPVTEASFWSDSLGLAQVHVPFMALNHARAQILSPYEPEPTAG